MKKNIFFGIIVLLLCSPFCFGQESKISGILTDSDGLPIPGVNIVLKGTTRGTQTNFDGEYSIVCKPGDILVFSYVGFTTTEVKVTSELLSQTKKISAGYVRVKLIKSNAYTDALKMIGKVLDTIPSLEQSNKTINKNLKTLGYNKIKEVKIKNKKVKLKLYRPKVYFETGFNSTIGIRYVSDHNIPELQRRYSQGLSLEGSIQFQGAETNTIFSYGPQLSLLEFNGSDYEFDDNGQLVNLGEGNGEPAIAYDNNILQTSFTNTNHLFFNAASDIESFDFDFQNSNNKDIFNKELNVDNKITFKYERPTDRQYRNGWYAYISYQNQKNNQPNLNGFINNLLLNSWVTPPTFSNKQGFLLDSNQQRRFSNLFNNPEWLLENNRNSIENIVFTASAIHSLQFNENTVLKSDLNYTFDDNIQKFGVYRGTAGFNEGFYSDKNITKNTFNAGLDFDFEKEFLFDNSFNLNSKIDYTYDDMFFSLYTNEGIDVLSFDNPLDTFERLVNQNRHIVRLTNKIELDFEDGYNFKIVNNSYFSSIQNNKWFLPSIIGSIDLEQFFDWYSPFSEILLKGSYSQNINDMPLYYDNLSHNSLVISSDESLGYTSNNDLFITSAIDLEEVESFELNLDFGFRLFQINNNFSFGFYHTQTNGSVFPVLEQNRFNLENIADVRNIGFEAEYNTYIWLGNYFAYRPKISFSTYNSIVTNLYGEITNVAIAGFSNVSKNLIEGEATGSILGSAFLRDANNNVVVGPDGYPLIEPDQKIIGDPIPDFNIGFSQSLDWKNFQLEIIIDIQKGGDIWNGTQNVLNYVGTSQESAVLRNTTGFVFKGVNQQGSLNTNAVDFYNPNRPFTENRFVRYGFDGVAEEAIEDGSYLNIRSINLSYDFYKYNEGEDKTIKKCTLNLYANNLWTWSGFQGRSPYSTFFGNRSASALNFFNMPLISEVGFSLNIEI